MSRALAAALVLLAAATAGPALANLLGDRLRDLLDPRLRGGFPGSGLS